MTAASRSARGLIEDQPTDNHPTLLSLAVELRANYQRDDRLDAKIEGDISDARKQIIAAAEPEKRLIRVERGRLLSQAKAFHSTKAGFQQWLATAFDGRSVSDAYACMKLAGADDPEAAAEAEKANAAERQRKSRATKADEWSVTLTPVTDKPAAFVQPAGPITYVPPGAQIPIRMSDPIDPKAPTPEPIAEPEPVSAEIDMLSLVRQWWAGATEDQRQGLVELVEELATAPATAVTASVTAPTPVTAEAIAEAIIHAIPASMSNEKVLYNLDRLDAGKWSPSGQPWTGYLHATEAARAEVRAEFTP